VTSADANAFGSATITLNVTRDSGGNITGATAKTDFSVSNFRNAESIIAAHLHDGLAGHNGPVVVDSGISTSAPLPLTGGATAFSKAGLTLPTPIAQDLIANPTTFYFNVNTNTNPDGAIRGQLAPRAPLPQRVVFTTQLQPANEVPPVTVADINAVGEAVVTLDVAQNSLGAFTAATANFMIEARNLPATDTIINAQVHMGAVGTNGSVVIDSGISPGSPVTLQGGNALIFKGNLTVPPGTAESLIANPALFYFNVHTNTNTGGAMRGQLAPVSLTTTPITFVTTLLPANEVPPVTGVEAAGSGFAVFNFVPTRDATGAIVSGTAQFDFLVAGLPPADSVVMAHTHEGMAGANGPIRVDSGIRPTNPLALSSAGTATFTASGLAVPSGIIPSLLTSPEGFYFNVHTNVNQGGAMRGQLAQVPVITAVSADGKNLVATGTGFTTGSVLLVNDSAVRTKQDPNNPAALTGKKALKLIAPGASAAVEAQTQNGLQSPPFIFTRPQ